MRWMNIKLDFHVKFIQMGYEDAERLKTAQLYTCTRIPCSNDPVLRSTPMRREHGKAWLPWLLRKLPPPMAE